MQEFFLQTQQEEMVDITRQIAQAIRQQDFQAGSCLVFVPHTTAAVMINENADPDVVRDLLRALDAMVPKLSYAHAEGNSRAHVKSVLVGASVTVPVVQGELCLGRWQGIYFCEFDGPRERSFQIRLHGE